ncbi:hypothetical protein [Bartonella machadoae]|uniref:hypothetical protein n=1 Tax=Bartonella machadoae TaxID=2893471 RepID=UPI001F4C811D|nr:hypothetical protein [Bartonella machadoae]UNE53948.1 hypothetical protein LNM86_10255 [Bartonella machadoae]
MQKVINMLKILLIIVLLPIAIGIIEGLFESLPDLIMYGAIHAGFMLFGGVLLCLGYTLSAPMLTIANVIHAICRLKLRRRTWKETFSFCAVASLPPLISSHIGLRYIDAYLNFEHLESIWCITTIIYFIASHSFICTFDGKDLKSKIIEMVEFYCAVPTLLFLAFLNKYSIIPAIILGILWLCSWISRISKRIPDEKENSNENTSGAH